MYSRTRMPYRCLLVLAAVFMGGLSVADLQGQAIYGSIYGQVTDSSGAAVPNATVTVKNVAKGTSVQATTNSIGEYTVEHLIPDVYDVTVAAPGFRGRESQGIRVSADTSPKVDLKLDVGSTTETVTVTGEVPQLKTDRADVALVLNEKTVSDLPNSGRNFASLELLIPGTQVMGWSQNTAENPQGSPTVQINGQHFSGVAYELDGAANQDPILGQIVINPPLDAVTEAKITTQNYDAQFGQAVAAVVTAQTKSGTNGFHGDLFDYRRTDATQARNPYSQFAPDPVTGRLLPAAKYNQFGASIGGPIRKNKAFFFADYQGTRQILGSSAIVTVPTALTRSSCLSGNGCDLSDYLTANGPAKGQIYNPRVMTATGPAPFVNDFIPTQYLSSQALALLALIPAPNAPGTTNNYSGSGSGRLHNDSVDVKIDDQLSERTHAFARYSYFGNGTSSTTIFGKGGGQGFSSPTNSFGGTASGRSQSAVFGMDIALNPKLLTDFRLGYLRYHVKTQKYDGTENLATNVGIPGLNLGDSFTAGAPAFFVENSSGTGGDGLSNFGSALGVNACNCPLLETEDQYQIVNNWTKVLGTHSVKFGVDIRYARNLRVPSDSNRAGELHFSATDTENTTDSTLSAPGGMGLASFLIGDVTNMSRYVSVSTNAKESQKRMFTYLQDSWRITPKLTMNYGLRWELYFPETVNGKGQGGFPDLNTGEIRVAGYGPFNTAMNVSKTWKTLAPRLGIAYQLNPKTVIRTGYGRSFDIGVFGSIFGHMLTQNLPVLVNQNLTNSGANTAAFNLAVGPTAFVFPSVPASGVIPIGVGNNAKIRSDPNVFPTIDAWNLAVQRQLTNTSSVTVAYVGNKGTHTFMGDDKSTNPNEAAPCLPASQSFTGQPLCYNPAAPAGSLTETSDTSKLRPYFSKFGFTQDLTFYHNGFDTNYNALQVSYEKRFSQGLQLNANFALQRGYNYGNDEEVYKKSLWGRLDDLREKQLTVFGNYELPFGKSRRFGGDVPTWLNYVIGGYELSTSIDWASGLPFSATLSNCSPFTPAGPCRPNKGSGSFPLKLTSFDPTTHSRTYFIPPGLGGAFTSPSLLQTGTSPRNAFTGPGLFNADLSLMKNFPIRESVAVEFRMDAFNVFNIINPANPGNTCIDCTVGSGAGTIHGMALGTAPRQLQFALTIKF
jgi:Carboxypeptidase regulatory-like domain/TonB dependent receptor